MLLLEVFELILEARRQRLQRAVPVGLAGKTGDAGSASASDWLLAELSVDKRGALVGRRALSSVR